MEIKTVGECFYQIRNGANIKQGDADGGYPITRIETTANDKFNRDRMGYAGITDISKYQNYVLEDGDLLMSHINSVQYLGRTVLYEKQGNEQIIHGMNLLGLKANRSIVIPAYAKYCFYSHYFREQIGNITKKSVNQASFSVTDLKKLKIRIPSLGEQKHIVETLDKANGIIGLRRQALQKLDELVKARFFEMFGDPNNTGRTSENKHKIGELCDVTKLAGFEFSEYITYKDSGEIIMLRGLNCKQGKLVLDNVKYIDRETSHKLPRSRLYKGDILMTYAGTIGDVAMVDEDDKYHLAPNVAKISIVDKEKVNPTFLVHLFMYSHDYIMSFASQVAQASINMQKIRDFEYIIPSIDEQDEFERFANQVDKSKAVVQEALDKAQLLFDSLMQEYFG